MVIPNVEIDEDCSQQYHISSHFEVKLLVKGQALLYFSFGLGLKLKKISNTLSETFYIKSCLYFPSPTKNC